MGAKRCNFINGTTLEIYNNSFMTLNPTKAIIVPFIIYFVEFLMDSIFMKFFYELVCNNMGRVYGGKNTQILY